MEAAGCSAHLSPSSVAQHIYLPLLSQVLAVVVPIFLSIVCRVIDTFCFHVGYIQDTVFCVDCIGRTVNHWLSSIFDCYLFTTDCFD